METLLEQLHQREADVEELSIQLRRQRIYIEQNDVEMDILRQNNERLQEDVDTVFDYWRRDARELEDVKNLREELTMALAADEALYRNRRFTTLRAIIEQLGDGKFFEVKSPTDKHVILWYQADRSLQLYCREVLDIVACYWSRGIGIPKLGFDSIEVHHGKPIIIGSANCTEYVAEYRSFLRSVFGPNSHNRIFQNLNKRLREHQTMNLDEFQSLYFHMFFSSIEEIAAFPAPAYEQLKGMYIFTGQRKIQVWKSTYNSWIVSNRPRNPADFDLDLKILDNEHACRIMLKSGCGYGNSFHEEVRFVRNMTVHFNDDYPGPGLALRDIGLHVFSTFPDIALDLFDFFVENQMELDFFNLRKKYS